jgi:hypothetical protein
MEITSIFKFELSELKVERCLTGGYFGKGKGKLGSADVLVDVRKGYKDFDVKISDLDGKKVDVEDLKRLGFEFNTDMIGKEYDSQVKKLEVSKELENQIKRGNEYKASPMHIIKSKMEESGFECVMSPTLEQYAKGSGGINLTCTKNEVQVGIGLTYEGKFEIYAGDYMAVHKKTSKLLNAVDLAEAAHLTVIHKINEKKQLADIFETERLRLEKELGISVQKDTHSYPFYWLLERRMRMRHLNQYSSYDLYKIIVKNEKAEDVSIKFKSDAFGITIVNISNRISQAAFATLINRVSEVMEVQTIKRPSGRKLNPIRR